MMIRRSTHLVLLAAVLVSNQSCDLGLGQSAASSSAASGSSCDAGGSSGTTGGGSSSGDQQGPPLVCDPFQTGNSNQLGQGLSGKLYFLPPELQDHANSVAEVQRYGTPINADFHFADLNIPTRPFDEGFTTQDGQVLQTPDGTTLYEYFSFHLESVLKLGGGDVAGDYQLAVLSDDGSVVQLNPDSRGLQQWIGDDGLHPSHLGCAPKIFTMTAASRIPLVVDYYQGPRYHIALVLLWRKIDPGTSLADIACDQEGNSTFFDPTVTPSAPTPLWNQMLARGWKVLTPSNYELPDANDLRPCVPISSPSPSPSPSISPSPSPTPTPSPAPTCTGIGCNGGAFGV